MVSSEEELAVEVACLDGIHVDLSWSAEQPTRFQLDARKGKVLVYSVNHGQPICVTVQPEEQQPLS